MSQKRAADAIEFCLKCKKPEWVCHDSSRCPFTQTFGQYAPATMYQHTSGVPEKSEWYDVTELAKAADRVLGDMETPHK